MNELELKSRQKLEEVEEHLRHLPMLSLSLSLTYIGLYEKLMVLHFAGKHEQVIAICAAILEL